MTFPFPIVAPINRFPRIVAMAENTAVTAVATRTVSFGTTLTAGQIALVMFSAYRDIGISITTPGGWTDAASATTARLAHKCFYLVASGGETSVSVTVSSSANFCSWEVYIIEGGQSVSGTQTTATGAGTAPNGPSHSPSWGSAANLWVTTMCSYGTETANSAPSGYGDFDQINVSTGGFDAPRTACAARSLLAATEDPPAFGVAVTGANNQWIATTLAVRPL